MRPDIWVTTWGQRVASQKSDNRTIGGNLPPIVPSMGDPTKESGESRVNHPGVAIAIHSSVQGHGEHKLVDGQAIGPAVPELTRMLNHAVQNRDEASTHAP